MSKVRDRQHLFELMADEDHRGALRLQCANNREQIVGLLGRQHGCGLIQNQNLGLAVERHQRFIDVRVVLEVLQLPVGLDPAVFTNAIGVWPGVGM